MNGSDSIAVIFLRAFASVLERGGIDVPRLVAEVGIDPRVLDDPDERVPAERMFRLLEHAARLTGDDALGLHAAEAIPFGAFAVLDYVAASSRNVGEGLERIARYYSLVHNRAELDLKVSGGEARLTHRMHVPVVAPRLAVEFMFATIALRGRSLTGRPWPIRHVRLVHEAPVHTAEHARVFGAPVLFAQFVNEMAFDARFLEHPLVAADDALSATMDRYAKSLMARLPVQRDPLEDVRRAVASTIRGRDASVSATARALCVSVRTMQRRLRDMGTSHQEVVDDVRRDLATSYLGEADLAIGEVAYLLGFAEPSTFHRAFKKWTGTTPGEFRRRARTLRGARGQ